MEKIKELVDIRFQIIKQFKKEIIQLKNEDSSFEDNSNMQRKILKFIINAKKEEKQRVNIENKLLDVLFNQRDTSQFLLLQFYQTSISIMNCLHQYFKLETENIFNKEPQYIDIATLYVEFFQQVRYPHKVDEIKMIIQNQLYEKVKIIKQKDKNINEKQDIISKSSEFMKIEIKLYKLIDIFKQLQVPFFCLLLKQLVEMMREQFEKFIKENSNIQLKYLKQNRNRSSEKDVKNFIQNQDIYESQKQSTLSQRNETQIQFIKETLKPENKRNKGINRISVSSLESRYSELKTDVCHQQDNKKQQSAFKSSLSNLQGSNIEIQLQTQQKNVQIQINNLTISKNNSNQSDQNSFSNLNATTNCSSTKNISNHNGMAQQNINSTLQNINSIQHNSQNQYNVYQSQYNINDKKKISPQKRSSNINNQSNDLLDLEINNFSMEMFNFLLKKVILPDGSISDQGQQQLLNYMISKNQQIKATLEEYYSKYNEKYPKVLQQQLYQMKNNLDRYAKRRKNMDQTIQKNQINLTRPYTSYGSVCQNQSLNQSFLKIDKKQYLSSTKDQFYTTNNSQQINTESQYRPFSRSKYRQDQINNTSIKNKIKHLSLEQNRLSLNINDNINQNENKQQINQNRDLLTVSLFNNSQDNSQEKQIQNLTKLSQNQFVQRMRSSNKIYYLSRKNNVYNQTYLTSFQNQSKDYQQKNNDNSYIGQGKSNSILNVSSNQVVINTRNQIAENETTQSAMCLATKENYSKPNLNSYVGSLDKTENQENNQTLTTSISSNRNQQQNHLVIPNPQYQYFYNSSIKQQQPNNVKTNSSIDVSHRPKTASETETSINIGNGQKGKINLQIQQQNNRKYRSRSINQSKNSYLNQNNWINTQSTDQSVILYNSQNSQGDLIKNNAESCFQANSINELSFYGTLQSRNNQIPQQINQQLGSNTLPIQNQIKQLNNYQQFQINSAKKNNYHQSSLENYSSIKEKYYCSNKDKRRISQSYNQSDQYNLNQKTEKSFNLIHQSNNSLLNSQKQFMNTQQSIDDLINNKIENTDTDTYIKYAQMIDDNIKNKNTIPNNNLIKIDDHSINQDKLNFSTIKSNQYRLYTPYQVSNLMTQDIMSNAIQQAMQQKPNLQEYRNQGHIKISHKRISSKKI